MLQDGDGKGRGDEPREYRKRCRKRAAEKRGIDAMREAREVAGRAMGGKSVKHGAIPLLVLRWHIYDGRLWQN